MLSGSLADHDDADIDTSQAAENPAYYARRSCHSRANDGYCAHVLVTRNLFNDIAIKLIL
jgi:hypothetical protein